MRLADLDPDEYFDAADEPMRATCSCGHLVIEHDPQLGTCAYYGEGEAGLGCYCETCSVGPDDHPLRDVPLCARAMGCLCAWHAVGAPAEDECDANEERARMYASDKASR